jgi:hypothetical protein
VVAGDKNGCVEAYKVDDCKPLPCRSHARLHGVPGEGAIRLAVFPAQRSDHRSALLGVGRRGEPLGDVVAPHARDVAVQVAQTSSRL